MKPSVVQMAREVLDMHNELMELRAEVHFLREKRKEYDEFVQQSLRHGQQQMAGWLKALTDPNSPIVKGLNVKDA